MKNKKALIISRCSFMLLTVVAFILSGDYGFEMYAEFMRLLIGIFDYAIILLR